MAWEKFAELAAASWKDVDFNFNLYNYRMHSPSATVPTVAISKLSPYKELTRFTVSSYLNLYAATHFPGEPTPIIGKYRISAELGPLTVEREIKNTAPTMPGAFTQPTGTLEHGDVRSVSWGGSSDAEGNFTRYKLEYALNGSSTWTHHSYPTTNSANFTVPATATSVKFRVRAEDAGGLVSAWSDSATLTVTKPMYYWSKHQKIVKNILAMSAFKTSGGNAVVGTPVYHSYRLDEELGFVGVDQFSTMFPNSNFVDKYVISDDRMYLFKMTSNTWRINDNTAGFSASLSEAYVKEKRAVKGSLIQSGIVAQDGSYPNDGEHTDGYWYVRGSRVNQSIAPPGGFSSPVTGTKLKPGVPVTLTFAASAAAGIAAYEVEYRNAGGNWAAVGTHATALNRNFTPTTDKAIQTVAFRVRARDTSGVYSDWVYSEPFVIEHNVPPTITLLTENNKTLYEKDAFVIEGSAKDEDIGDVVIVYLRLNGGVARGIETKLSSGTPIPFKETFTFREGKLYKDDTAVTDKLSESTPYKVEVWSEDNQRGKSEVEERTFYVVPNRPPSLTIDPIESNSGLIDPDKFTVTGESFDLDGNDVIVRYRINNGMNVEIHNGPPGKFSFDVQLSKLQVGENKIVVEVTDTYDFKFSKTIKLNKTANLTPMSQSVQRYKIVPPAGSAQGVLLWVQRDEGQEIQAEISMTNGTEQEKFVPLTLDTTAPVAPRIAEDFFIFQTDTPAENIVLKLSWTGDKPITLLTGALTQ